MPKEKSINPAQAERKKQKAKEVKKGKADNLARRTERLARQNPARFESQLSELKALEASGGKLTNHEQKVLEGLERDLKAVKKARETLGDKAPKFGRGAGSGRGFTDGGAGRDGGRGVLGKRRREGGMRSDSDSGEDDVPEDVKAIPMPRDTPPPIPKAVLDKWYAKRRERWAARNPQQQQNQQRDGRGAGTSANNVPLGENARIFPGTGGTDADEGDDEDRRTQTRLPAVEAKTVYESAPMIRDLRKEAVNAFMPAAVRLKMEKAKGQGGLVEPEEADRLEREGYLKTGTSQDITGQPKAVEIEEVEDEDY